MRNKSNSNFWLPLVLSLTLAIGMFSGCAQSTNMSSMRAPDLFEVDADDPFAVAMNPKRNYLILVNSENEYDFNGSYNKLLQDDLIWVSDVYGEPTAVEKAAYLAFSQLQAKLREEGLVVGFYSGYRTIADQQWVYDTYSVKEDWNKIHPVAKPGFSEHHTGLNISVLILHPDENGEMIWYTETAERQKTIPEFRLFHETLADYGFIDRYPEGKEEVTHTPCEPDEIRFVGSSKIAHEIMDSRSCLEEYVAGK